MNELILILFIFVCLPLIMFVLMAVLYLVSPSMREELRKEWRDDGCDYY